MNALILAAMIGYVAPKDAPTEFPDVGESLIVGEDVWIVSGIQRLLRLNDNLEWEPETYFSVLVISRQIIPDCPCDVKSMRQLWQVERIRRKGSR